MSHLIIFILIVIILILILSKERIKKVFVYKNPQKQEKEQNKKKILELFDKEIKITNNNVEKLLGVSDATATRYLDALEKEGRIEQIGKTGRSVYYRLKQ